MDTAKLEFGQKQLQCGDFRRATLQSVLQLLQFMWTQECSVYLVLGTVQKWRLAHAN